MYKNNVKEDSVLDRIVLCDEYVLYKREDKELLLFPNIPRWVVLFSGGADFLKNIAGKTMKEIKNILSKNELEFVEALLENQILVYSSSISNKDNKNSSEIYPLIAVWLNITSKCNLKCKHCFLGEQKAVSNVLSVEEIEKLIEEMLLVKGEVPIALDVTGGEPLLRQDFLDIIKVCKKEGIFISVPTNGLLLSSQIAEELAKENVNLTISLDGYCKKDHEFIRGENTFERTIDKIKMAVSYGINVTLSFAVHNGNQDSVMQYLELAKSLGVKTVNYTFLNEIGNALANNLLVADEDIIIKNTLLRALEDPDVFSLIQGNNCVRTLETVMLPVKLDCCGSGINTCAVGADGEVYPCPSFQDKRFSAGNIREKRFSEIWTDSKTFTELRRIRVGHLNEQCAKCEFRYFCGGGCRAQATNGGIKPLNSISSKCEKYKRNIQEMMWLLAENPRLTELKTRTGATFFH